MTLNTQQVNSSIVKSACAVMASSNAGHIKIGWPINNKRQKIIR